MKKINITILTATVLSLAIVLAPTFASTDMLTRQLDFGARGSDVSSLQAFLATDVSVYPSGLVTGYFGPLTRAAVMRFQAKNGISQVGRVGPQTLAAINAQMGGVSWSGLLSTPYIQAAPAFTGLSSVSVSGSRAMVTVSTNVPTRATMYYSPNPIVANENLATNPISVEVGGQGVQANSNLQTSHTLTTLDLVPNTTYYAMIVVTDINGIVSVIQPAPFRSN